MAADVNIYVVIDGSGSMSGQKNDVVKGINEFIDDQKNETLAGEDVRFWLTSFDSQVMEVYQGEDITLVNPVSVKETFLGGGTALLDALGKTLTTAEDDAAPRNVVVVYTDGDENASNEFTKEQIGDLIEKLTKTGKWQFVYLGAEFADFASDRAQSTLASTAMIGTYSAVNTSKMHVNTTLRNVSQTVSHYRNATDAQLADINQDGLIASASAAGVDWDAVTDFKPIQVTEPTGRIASGTRIKKKDKK